MPKQRIRLVNDEIYHVVLRAVGDTEVFIDKNDYYRGIFSIYEFNNKNLVSIWRRRRDRMTEKKTEAIVRCPTPHNSTNKRDQFVELMAFAFMPNHIHLLLKQIKDAGITNFMKKVGGGYANYFNKKYSRKGHLFNRFRAVHVSNDDQLRNVFAYIHVNPVALIEPGFKENGIKNSEKALKFLENYKWSSYQDYVGNQNFESVTSRNFLSETLGDCAGCRNVVKNWLEYKEKKEIEDAVLLE